MLPGNGLGDTDKSCYTTDTQYAFQHKGLNTNDIKEYIRNPHKFNIKRVMDGRYYNLWSTDNDRRDANDDVVIKSVYDPSPVGYTVPASNAFTGFTTTGQNVGYWDTPFTPEQLAQLNINGDFNKGYYFYTKPNRQGNIFWFPASGCRDHLLGSVVLVSTDGFYWLGNPSFASPDDWYLYFNSCIVYPLNSGSRSWGQAVRSAEEKKGL